MNRKLNLSLWLAFLLLLSGSALAATIDGLVYYDADNSAVACHTQECAAPDAGIAGVEINLFGPAGIIDTTMTLADGAFTFSDLSAGAYLIDLNVDADHECTGNNRAIRLPYAVCEGTVNLLAFGDSNGVVGSDHPYPDRLADHLGQFAAVNLVNVSIEGSTAAEWAPGSNYFENTLAPELGVADVITFTLGGNDLLGHFGDPPYEMADLLAALIAFPDVFAEIKGAITDIVAQIHLLAPQADLIYLMYPVFASSQLWIDVNGDIWPLVKALNTYIFTNMRQEFSNISYLIIADIMGSVDPDYLIDEFLYDDIHPNDAGHQWYADETFLALGGVLVEEAKLGETPMYGFADQVLEPRDEPLPDDDVADDDLADDDLADDELADDDAANGGTAEDEEDDENDGCGC